MFQVLGCLKDQHDPKLLAVAALICVLGSAIMASVSLRAGEVAVRYRRHWTLAAGLTSGLAVWSTHFVAMLAYQGGMPLMFRPFQTAGSFAICVVMAACAVGVSFRLKTTWAALASGTFFTLGVTAMHYTGMYALAIPVRFDYDLSYVATSVGLTLLFASAASLVMIKLEGVRRLAVATLLIAAAICSLHFGGMSALVMVPDPSVSVGGMAVGQMPISIAIGAVLMLSAGAYCIALVDRTVADLRSVINGSLEALVLVRRDKVLDVNPQFLKLVGETEHDVVGLPISRFLALPRTAARADGSPVETMIKAADGRSLPIEVFERAVEWRGQACRVLVLRDLSERRAAEARIAFLAHHDPLTSLPNRALFEDRLSQAIERADRGGGKVAILCLDLDRFKAVNDIFGHAEGDRTLCRVAQILKDAVRTSDTIARLGGDEFAVILSDARQPEASSDVAHRILRLFAEKMDTSRDPTAVGVSIGVAIYPDDGQSMERVLVSADNALYRAKACGRGKVHFFDADIDRSASHRRELEHDLRTAVATDQLTLAYQPLADTKTGRIIGYEALIRWTHPRYGTLSPADFIPIAEESGAIVQLGAWVLERACAEAASWQEPLKIAVNISAAQLRLPSLAEQVFEILDRTGLDGSRLEMEITESMLLQDWELAGTTLHRLKERSIHIVMDDFGTGYSSLNSLRHFPFDKIKIDRSFIAGLEHDESAGSIVRAIIGLGRSLNLPIVAEGVETTRQLELMRAQRCEEVQGFLIGHPGEAPSTSTASRAAA